MKKIQFIASNRGEVLRGLSIVSSSSIKSSMELAKEAFKEMGINYDKVTIDSINILD